LVSTKILLSIVGIAVVVIAFLPIFPKSIPVTVSYQEPTEVPLEYTFTHSYSWVGLLDWELQYTCTITNVDNAGGTFTVLANFNEGSTLRYSTSDQKYIGPGQQGTFQLQSKGLSFSTDWQTRYNVVPNITPTTKIEYHIAYRTEYQTKYVNILGYFG
jgi:hypothetical protein